MIELDDNKARLEVDSIHRWLSSSYWCPGIERELVERAIAGSHCLGAYKDGVQVGYARAITDYATFAWIADVWIDEPVRGQGIGRSMMSWFIEHPRYAGIRRIALTTLDAHGVYAELGFKPLLRPQNYMERLSAEAVSMLEAMS